MRIKTDGELQRDVIAELEWDPSVDHADIGVSVHDGVVTLSGYVKSYLEKIAAEKVARRVAGVRAIAEDLHVRLPVEPKAADHEIAKRIVDLFAWHAAIPIDRIAVKVEHGWVTLSGTLDWQYQADEARKAAGRISGVRGITSDIELRTLPVAANVKERILAALKRQAELDGATVTVVTDGSKVRLGGRVGAWRERGIAERAAWAAPGVTEVIDNIVVAC